jgi:D-lactate dehydrogenase
MVDSFIGHSLVRKGAAALNKISTGRVPVWPKSGFTVSKKSIFSPVVNPDYIHVSSCVNRVLAGDTSGLSSSDYLREIADAAGIRLGTLDTMNDHCCGMAFSSRGFDTTGKNMRQDLLDELNAVSNGGKIPILVDMSPCTQYLMESQDVSSLVIIDSVEFLNKVKPRLGLELLDESVFVHNVCSAQKMGKENDLFDLASDCVSSVETALEPFCCGTGGDRGFRHPELIKNAVDRSVKGLSSQKGVSSSRTCELGLSEALDMEFSSIEALVYRAIKK